jgi:cyanophycinase-like exopeptidase
VIELAERLEGKGCLALIGGGEFSFGETAEADLLWTGRTPEGSVGFLPTASGSADYGKHLATYLEEGCEREVETIPIYRSRDARREKNLARLGRCSGIYIGGGIGDDLVDVLMESPALEAIEEAIRSGSTVVAVAAAAHAAGVWMRGLSGREYLAGFGWLRETVIEANFLPTHDHRLRQLLDRPGVRYGLGLPAGSCFLISAEGVEMHGPAFFLEDAEADLGVLNQTATTDRE